MSGSRQHPQQHQQEPGKHDQPVAEKKESAVGVERHAAGQAESAEIEERHPAKTSERAETGERLAEQSERADMEERDAGPVIQILGMDLTSPMDEENPAGVDQQLCCAVINLPLSCDGANIAARNQMLLVAGRDQDELQGRVVAALISEYRMAQADAEAAWETVLVWMQPPATREAVRQKAREAVDTRAAMRA